MKTLYREYRPLSLTDVIGQEQVTKPLSNALNNGKIGHAYLFVGPRGCGKTSVARILAHEVNGFKYELEDNYIDIIEIDGASNRGIDDIRELREKAAIAPTVGKYKVYIIDEVHMLTKEAFNALLKTLEEPPAHVIFIMATTDLYKVPVTITSRAQTYVFKLADHKTMLEHLRKIAQQSKIEISDDALDIIVKRGGGSFRDSLSLLDQISSLSDKAITKEQVVSALGLPEDEKLQGLITSYLNADLTRISSEYKELLISGVKPDIIVEELITMIIDSPSPDLLPLLDKLTEIREPFIEAKLLVALTSRMAPMVGVSPGPVRTPTANVVQRPVHKASVETLKAAAASAQPPVTQEPPTPTTTMEPAIAFTGDFSWDEFLPRIENLNEVIYRQLLKCEHEFVDGKLDLYPRTKIIKNILEKPKNKQILIDNAGGIKITIHEPGEHPLAAKNDETLNKISAIMGGEVMNYEGGNNPF